MNKNKLKALVVGYGSIGKRHADNLQKLGVDVLFLRRAGTKSLPAGHFANLAKALELKPDFAVIANPTSLHKRRNAASKSCQ